MDEREYHQLNHDEMWTLLEIVGLPKKCTYCGKKIKKGDSFSVFNMPDRICCTNILCLVQLVEDDE